MVCLEAVESVKASYRVRRVYYSSRDGWLSDSKFSRVQNISWYKDWWSVKFIRMIWTGLCAGCGIEFREEIGRWILIRYEEWIEKCVMFWHSSTSSSLNLRTVESATTVFFITKPFWCRALQSLELFLVYCALCKKTWICDQSAIASLLPKPPYIDLWLLVVHLDYTSASRLVEIPLPPSDSL